MSIRTNDEGAQVQLSTQTGWTLRYYCGRHLGRDAIPGSNGRCGPNNGPQCQSCYVLQNMLRNDESAWVQPGRDGRLFYCGRRLGRQAIPGSDGQCGPTNGPQCQSCRRFQEAFMMTRGASGLGAAAAQGVGVGGGVAGVGGAAALGTVAVGAVPVGAVAVGAVAVGAVDGRDADGRAGSHAGDVCCADKNVDAVAVPAAEGEASIATPVEGKQKASSASAAPSPPEQCFVCMRPLSADATLPHAAHHLPCGHALGAECAHKVVVNNVVECPVCSKTGKAAGELLELANQAQTSSLAEDQKLVAMYNCVECEGRATASDGLYCQNCACVFCPSCFAKAHPANLKSMSAHTSIPLNARQRIDILPVCPTHNRPCELLCLIDQAIICHYCGFSESHNAHKSSVVFLCDVATKRRAEADATLAKDAQLRTAMTLLSEKVRRAEETLPHAVEAAITKVRTRFDDMVRVVREQQKKLEDAITSYGAETEAELKIQEQQVACALVAVREAQVSLEGMKSLADVDIMGDKGKAAEELIQAARLRAWVGACERPVYKAGSEIPLHLPTDGAIERAICGYGMAVGPAAPVWEAMVEGDKGDKVVRVKWRVARGAQVYEVVVRDIMVARGVGEKIPQREGAAAELPVAAANGFGKAGQELELGLEDRNEYRQVHRGAEQSILVSGLLPGRCYGMWVRGVGPEGLVGKWSKVLVVHTKDGMPNLFDGMGAKVNWPVEPLRLKSKGALINVRGREGMRVQRGTGAVGYVEACVANSGGRGQVYLALCMQVAQVPPPEQGQWGSEPGSFRWYSGGFRPDSVPGMNKVSARTLEFRDGDSIGLMVDCRSNPRLRFFVNGVQEHAMDLPEGVWYPGGGVGNGELVFVDSPNLPEES